MKKRKFSVQNNKRKGFFLTAKLHHQKSVKNDKILTEKRMVKTQGKSLHGFRILKKMIIVYGNWKRITEFPEQRTVLKKGGRRQGTRMRNRHS